VLLAHGDLGECTTQEVHEACDEGEGIVQGQTIV
jgi:hypothetical protein